MTTPEELVNRLVSVLEDAHEVRLTPWTDEVDEAYNAVLEELNQSLYERLRGDWTDKPHMAVRVLGHYFDDESDVEVSNELAVSALSQIAKELEVQITHD